MKLFRNEALDHQRTRLYGEVIITQPVSYNYIIALFVIIILGTGFFLANHSFTRKANVVGYLIPEKGLANIYADRGGTIAEIFVRLGDKVHKGQKLAHLKLERRLPSGITSQQEFQTSLKREVDDLNKSLLNSDIRQAKETRALGERIKGQQLELETLFQEWNLTQERIKLAQKQYDAALKLSDKGYATERLLDGRQENLLNLKQQSLSYRRQATSLKNTIEQSRSTLDVLPLRFNEEKAAFRQRKEGITRQLADLALSSGYIVSSPIDGIISSILKSEGATAIPNQSLIVIRPLNSKLIARLMVPSRAAGLLKVGQAAKIQYDAFPYQRFGVFQGTIKQISQNIFSPGQIQGPIPMQEAFYLVEMELENQFVRVARKKVFLISGMLLKANVLLEQRTLMQWVLDPILSLKGKL